MIGIYYGYHSPAYRTIGKITTGISVIGYSAEANQRFASGESGYRVSGDLAIDLAFEPAKLYVCAHTGIVGCAAASTVIEGIKSPVKDFVADVGYNMGYHVVGPVYQGAKDIWNRIF